MILNTNNKGLLPIIKTLTNPTRVRIITECSVMPQTYRALSKICNVTQSCISINVNHLVENGFVEIIHGKGNKYVRTIDKSITIEFVPPTVS